MRAGILTVAIALAAAGGLMSRPTTATSPGGAATSPGSQQSTTLTDQIDLAVTVYNSDIALVRDVRNLRLAAGTFDLQFMDIAATVNPATVHFRSLTEPRHSVCSNRTTSTTCSNRTSCFGSTWAARSRSCASGRMEGPSAEGRPGHADACRNGPRVSGGLEGWRALRG